MSGNRLSDKDILAARDDWKAWAKRFDWVLTGMGSERYNEHEEAAFMRPGDRIEYPWGANFTITREVRNDIDKALSEKATAKLKAKQEPVPPYVAVFNERINDAGKRALKLMELIMPKFAQEVNASIKRTKGAMGLFNEPPTDASRYYVAFVTAYVNEDRI